MANLNSGVYIIKDTTNKKYFVGSTDDTTSISNPDMITGTTDITILKEGLHRNDAWQIEKNVKSALDVTNDPACYNDNDTVVIKPEGFFSKLFRSKVTNTDVELAGWINDVNAFKDGSSATEEKANNDFKFESQLGSFLEHGFEAYTEEGERQGYDDPSKKNWNKQVQLLKVQLANNIDREYFIKKNKYSILEEAFKSTDNIVGDQIEFIMQKKRAQNEMEYISEQIALVKKEEGWYLMLHEALHDGFQDGSKKKLEELNNKYDLS